MMYSDVHRIWRASGSGNSCAWERMCDPQAMKRFLAPLMQRLGVSIIVTDDLASYKQVAEALRLEWQICQFHVRPWVGLAAHELKKSLPPEWIGVAEEMPQVLRGLPIAGNKRLVVLLRQFPLGS